MEVFEKVVMVLGEKAGGISRDVWRVGLKTLRKVVLAPRWVN